MIEVFDPQSGSSRFHWRWISFQGSDAKDFLHRLTTVNLKFLPIGKGAKGCFLSPQGKIRAYFTLWNYNSNEYGFELDEGAEGYWKKELLAVIDQYTFAEKLTLTETADHLQCRWLLLEDEELPQVAPSIEPYHTLATPETIRICHHGKRDFGKNWLTLWGKSEDLTRWMERTLPQTKPLKWEEIEARRIQNLTPKVDAEITSASMPLEIGLQDAIAGNKGCYPGQEVIEKVVSLGSPAKRLAQIRGNGPAPQAGNPIFNMGTLPPKFERFKR